MELRSQSFANSKPCSGNYHGLSPPRCVYKPCYTYTQRCIYTCSRPWYKRKLRGSCPYILCTYTKSTFASMRRTRYHEEDPHPLFLYTRARCFCLRVQEAKLVSTTRLFIPTLPCSYAQSVCPKISSALSISYLFEVSFLARYRLLSMKNFFFFLSMRSFYGQLFLNSFEGI